VFRIFVGNLHQRVTESDLRSAFEPHGRIASVRVVIDAGTGRSRGLGFVEMPDHRQGRAAIAAMQGVELDGLRLTVAEARPRATREVRRPRFGARRY
jgi:RNA recognition motif-containing protein